MESTFDPVFTPAEQQAINPRPKGKRYPLELWQKAKAAFVHGKGTMAEIAAMFGVSYDALRDRAEAEKWTALRSKRIEAVNLALIPPIPQPVIVEPTTPANPTNGRLATVEEQLDRIDEMLKRVETSRELDELTKAKDRLFRQWQVLAGVPNPGSRRPAKVKSRASSDPVAPIDPAQNPPLS